MVPNLGLPEPVQFPPTHRVEVDGKHETNKEPDQRHRHSLMVTGMVGHQAGQRRKQRAAADAADDPAAAALGVAAEAADRQGEDGGEDAALEEEDEREHGDAGLALRAHGCRDEDHDQRHEEHEHEAGLHDHEEACGGEPADREQALPDRVAV